MGRAKIRRSSYYSGDSSTSASCLPLVGNDTGTSGPDPGAAIATGEVTEASAAAGNGSSTLASQCRSSFMPMLLRMLARLHQVTQQRFHLALHDFAHLPHFCSLAVVSPSPGYFHYQILPMIPLWTPLEPILASFQPLASCPSCHDEAPHSYRSSCHHYHHPRGRRAAVYGCRAQGAESGARGRAPLVHPISWITKVVVAAVAAASAASERAIARALSKRAPPCYRRLIVFCLC